jgi:diaminopropionate ammonia-lyase
MCRFIINRFREDPPHWRQSEISEYDRDDIFNLHRSIPGYKATPLHSLSSLAKKLGLGNIFVKDEGYRFGLKAFKVLGASYAIYRFISEDMGETFEPDLFYSTSDIIPSKKYTFCTATDGNHGRGVAWAAHQLNQKAMIFMPQNTVPARIKNIEKLGANVAIVDGAYDLAVQIAHEEARKNGWQIISDTSWPGYEQIPLWIQAGYTTIFREVEMHLPVSEKIDLVLVQAGVGALAACVAWYFNKKFSRSKAKIVSVEPLDAACLLESIDSPEGNPLKASGSLTSIMAGLNCGTPSISAWPLIKTGIDAFMAIPDSSAIEAMRSYYYPLEGDPQIISGESGASSMAALKGLCAKPGIADAREFLGLDGKSNVLLLNTEGDTDPEFFRKVIGKA